MKSFSFPKKGSGLNRPFLMVPITPWWSELIVIPISDDSFGINYLLELLNENTSILGIKLGDTSIGWQ